MNTKSLVVGQEVYMVSGIYGKKGKVVKIGRSLFTLFRPSVIVQVRAQGPIDEPTLMRFDANGKACYSDDIYNGNMGNIPGTHEFGPWELIDGTPDFHALWIKTFGGEEQ